MIEIKKTPAELEQEFYSKPLYLSYSGLNKLLFSPKVYYNHYILQQKEEKLDSHLIDGKVIHNLLLDAGRFDENFILLPSTLPTGNSRLVIDTLHKLLINQKLFDEKEGIQLLNHYTIEILEILKQINLHQSLKTDGQRLAKIITEESINYFEFLKQKGSKDLIDNETLERCREAIEALRADNKVCHLLGFYRSEMEKIDVINEKELAASAEDLKQSIGLKGIPDCIQVNYDENILYINDLKTTGKTITDFPETVSFYRYDLQAAIYNRLVRFVYKDVLDSNWQVIFNFIVIDKYNQVYCFEVSNDTIKNWTKDLDKSLNQADWHYKNRNYNLPYIFATGQVIL